MGNFELIETLWNVNAELSQPRMIRVKELIETLWNVNILHKGDSDFKRQN